jgi:hypothetical protein
VENIQIYLHAKFHIILRSLNISFYFFLTCLKNKWKKNSKMEKSSRAVSLQASPFLQHFQPSPSLRSRPAPFSSSGRCQAGPGVSQTPHVSLSPSQAETVMHSTCYGARYPPKLVPFLCSSPCCPSMKFRPRPAPMCSIQASVSYPSHPFACYLTCGPLASRTAAEA